MDLNKVNYVYKSYSWFLILLTCVSVYCGSTRGGFGSPFKRRIETAVEESTRIHGQRIRRQSRVQPFDKCSSREYCTGNETVIRTINTSYCYCDEACYNIFSDCCPDYERQCGSQKKQIPKQPASMWKCVEFSWSPIWPCKIEAVTGVWMIYRCQEHQTFDEIKTKCENAPSEFSYPVEDFLPVVGANGKTFRNKYCALCNKVENYTTWHIGVFTYVIPPEGYDLDMKLKFIENNGGMIETVSPRPHQPRRFCFGRNYINNCTSSDPRSIKSCVEGPVEVVTATVDKYLYFKNFACAFCNGYRDAMEWKTAQVCNPPLPQGFSVVFNLDGKKTTTNVVRKFCPSDTVYDATLKFCRKGYIVASSGQLTDQFLILLWLQQPIARSATEINSKLANSLKLALFSQFSIASNQISEMTFQEQDTINSLLVVSFRLTLTPFQNLIMANRNKTSLNATRENTAFLQLLDFKENLTLSWNSSYSLVKVISKRLSCYGQRKLQPNEYKINNQNGTLVVNRTRQVLLLQDYTVFEENEGNITLCLKLFFSDCEGAYVPLSPDEYEIFPNLTIYYSAKGTFINFGEYLIEETMNRDQSNTSTMILSKNATISVCLPLGNNYTETKTNYSTMVLSDGLRWLTLFGFSVSIICLTLLLITYRLFQELRTVPGLNLMNLSFSMLLSHLIWLIGTTHFIGTETCKILAIFEHYLFQVSFLAMSVISFHSCRAFSQPMVGRTANKSWRRFIKYSALVWLTPLIFVAICVILDKTETLLVDYGTSCWLGTKNAKLYLFLLPLAVLLIYNICTFIQTAVSLSRHEKNRKTLQLKEGKQNLLICTKLASLVGFPWLFAFFGVLFPQVETLEYLFVIFVCLQGLYIGMAFLFNKKTLKLYKDRLNIDIFGNTSSNTTRTFQMT